METADMFLVFGEKIAELQAAGHHAFFSYSGHCDLFDFHCYDGVFARDKPRAIDENCGQFRNRGEFVETCFNQANLLILKEK